MKSFKHNGSNRFAPYRRPEERGNGESDSEDSESDSDKEQDEEETKKFFTGGYIYKCRGECGQVCFCICLVMNVQNYNKVNQVNVFCTAEARNQHLQEEHEGEEYEDIELDGPYFKQWKVQYYVHQVISMCFNLHYIYNFKAYIAAPL